MAMIATCFPVVVAAVGIETAAMSVDDAKDGANPGDPNHKPEQRAASVIRDP